MNDTIKSTPAVVFIQENGIIRLPDGRFIARLDDEVSYESLPEFKTVGHLLDAHFEIDSAYYGEEKAMKLRQFAHEQHRQMLTLLNAREDESLMDAIQRTVSENRGENEKS